MRNKKRDSSHRKQHSKNSRRDRTNKLRRARPKSHQAPKHHRELMKRLRRTGQYIFGEDDK
jgi:hypothetical protein